MTSADIGIKIKKCVDDMWGEYDEDNNGFLDKEKTKKFVKDIIK
jgi:hypothetical protein